MNAQARFDAAREARGEVSPPAAPPSAGWRRRLAMGLAGGSGLAAAATLPLVLGGAIGPRSGIGLGLLFVGGTLATLYAQRLLARRLAAERRRQERGFRQRTAELIETEKRFADYARSAREWFWETDTEDRFVFLSSRFYEASGVRPEDVLGRKRESLAMDTTRDADRAIWSAYRRRIDNRLPYDDLRYTSRTADGREIVYCSSGKPFYDEDGRFLGYRGTARDATGEMQEARRRQAEQTLVSNAAAVLNDGFFIFDADDRLMMCNERFREIYHPVADLIEPGVPYEKLLRAIADRQILFEDDRHQQAWLEKTLAAHANPSEAFEEHLDGGQWVRVIKQRMPDGNLVGLCVDITPIKQIEEELAEAQRISSTGSYRMDFVGDRLVSISPQLASIYGFDETTLLEDDPYLYHLVHPEDVERVRAAYEGAILTAATTPGELIFEIEYRIRRADGELRHIVERAAASKVVRGRVTEVIGTLQDVTGRRQIEGELAQVQKIARIGSFRWNVRRDRATSYSAEMGNIYGRPLDEILPLSDREFVDLIVHPDDRARVLGVYRQSAERGEAYSVEFRVVRPDGELRHVVERAEVTDSRDGDAREFVGMIQDVTDEKLNERELEMAQKIARVGSFRWDVENECMASYSKEYLRIMGRSAAQMDALGLEGLIEEVIHPDDRQRVRATFERSQVCDERYDIAYRIRRPDGEYRHIVERCETSVRRAGRPVEQLGTVLDVTELRQFERELEDAQQLARIGSFRWNVGEQRLISCSRQYLEIHGLSRELAMALHQEQYLGFVHVDDRQRLEAAYAHIDQGGEALEIEYRLVRPDGEVRNVIERIGVSLWRDGRPAEQIGTLQDITERRLFEHQLEEAQRIAGVGSFHFSVQNRRAISVSVETARIYGRPVAELLTFDDRELVEKTVHPDDRTRVMQSYVRYNKSGSEYQIEFRLLRPDGEVRKVVQHAEPVLTHDGRVVELLGTLQDVTERVREDEEKRAADEMLEAAIENVPGGFLLVDAEGRIKRFNRRLFDLYPQQQALIAAGVAFERFIDYGLERGVYADAADDPQAWRQRRLDLAGRELGEYIDRMSDGRSIQVAVRRLPNGNVVGIHVDVSELEQARESAEQANAAKSDFLASMSHELRTPMHAILSFADLGIKRIDRLSQEKLLRYLENIRTSGNRLLFLLNDLLDLSKLEAGQMQLDVAPLNLVPLVRACIDEQTARLRDAGLRCELATSLRDARCACDSNRVYQVVSNVLSNAIKFSPEGGRIEIGVEARGNGFRIAVEDEGIGIPEDDLERIFDKFYQSARGRRHSGGTGLGLAICREIVDLHGGRIWAENNATGGSRILVELPARAGRA